MKTLAIIFITTLFINCSNKPRNFDGIGEIKLGANINSLSFSKSLKKTNENEYKIDSFQISNKIGPVKNLILKTENEEIYDVSFESTEKTNNIAIDSTMKVFHKHSNIHIAQKKSTPIQITEESDGDVDFSKITEKNNRKIITYRYFDIKKLTNIVDSQ